MSSAGYSGTPLAKKLGLKAGFIIRLVNQPDHYSDLFTDMPEGVVIAADERSKKQLIHYFTKELKALVKDITALKNEIEPNGMIWIVAKESVKSTNRFE